MILPLSLVETWLFLLLMALWAMLLFGGFAFGEVNEEGSQRIPRWARMASSFCLVIGAWIWFAVSQGTQVAGLAYWVAIGMSLGFVGDLFMAELVPLKPSILFGMAAFGLGHIAYIFGMSRLGLLLHLTFPNWPVLIFWWLLGLFGWYFVVYFERKPDFLRMAALPYSLLLASTAGIANSLALLDANFILVAIGAGLFLLSDLILAAQLFSEIKFPLIGDAVWLSYGPGQMLIVYGLVIFTIASPLWTA
jgi:hypothetical protein